MMNHKLKWLLLVSSWWACTAGPARLFARPSAGENPVEITFTTALVGGAPEQLYYQPKVDGDFVPVKFNRQYRSELHPYQGLVPVRFFQMKGKDAEGNPQYEVIATASGVTSGSRWLFLFDRPRRSGQWRVDVIPDDESQLPVNSLAIYNTTAAPLVAMVGDKVVPLPIGISKSVDIRKFQAQHKTLQTVVEVEDMVYETREVETINRAVTLIIVYKSADQVHRLFESSQVVSPGHRYLMLFLPPASEGSTRFRSKMLSERVEEPPEL